MLADRHSTLLKGSSEKAIDDAISRIDAVYEAVPKLCEHCQLIVKESVAKNFRVENNKSLQETATN
jgi:hypothetical protein